LVIKAVDVAGQSRGLGEPLLGAIPAGGQTVVESGRLLARLDRLPAWRTNDYLVNRLREALQHISRRNSAESLDDQLRYLAAVDADRLHASYAMIRLIIWAVPILGFLGTVVGITMAIASLRVDAVQESMQEVTSGLGVKFDTTALALTLSMILMSLQYFVDRVENALLAAVDRRAEEELVGRFARVPVDSEGQIVALRRTSQTVVESLDGMVRQIQRVMAQNAQSLAAVENALMQKADALGRAVEATGYVTRLEESLNRNLAALAGSRNFEETVMSLAAAIHLLNSRLAALPGAPTVQLERARQLKKAA
jgi:biopolymer transport protein ExbB/TolQ